MAERLPHGGVAVRVVMFAAPLAAVLAGVPQGYTPPVWLVGVVAVFSFAYAAMPEHDVGSATLVIVVAWWVVAAHDALPLSSVAAAGALLTAHLAGHVAAYGPPRLDPDPATVVLWVRRGVLLWAAAGLTWFVVVAETGTATSAAYWTVGSAVGLALAVLVTLRYPAAGDRRL
jgi:hypothetical protein